MKKLVGQYLKCPPELSRQNKAQEQSLRSTLTNPTLLTQEPITSKSKSSSNPTSAGCGTLLDVRDLSPLSLPHIAGPYVKFGLSEQPNKHSVRLLH